MIWLQCFFYFLCAEKGENIFEYLVNETGQWQHWSEKVPSYDYPPDSTPEYLSILVPNVDNVRMDYLMHAIMKQVLSLSRYMPQYFSNLFGANPKASSYSNQKKCNLYQKP